MAGTAYSKIDSALNNSFPYTAFREGTVSATTYQKWVEGQGAATFTNLNQDQINLSARFPRDKHDFVRRALSQCRALDIIPDDHYDADVTEHSLAHVDSKYEHGTYMTYIFPEENALLYALVKILRPHRAAFMGSYYGYWAAAAKAAHPQMQLTLLDVNPAVTDLARTSFERLSLEHDTAFVVGDAEGLAPGLGDLDLLVLDAEGPKSLEIPEDYRDKAIYYPHLKAALNNLVPGALVVAHNVILSNFTDGTYFEEKQSNYRHQYAKFLPLLRERFIFTIIDSTEGTLIARKL